MEDGTRPPVRPALAKINLNPACGYRRYSGFQVAFGVNFK
jgi:hypothetical protein